MIRIKWFGHSMWKIWNENVRIIADPFTDIGYHVPENEQADIVLISHNHYDHNNSAIIAGNPEVVSAEGDFSPAGIQIKTISVWHDDVQGKRAGSNLLLRFTIEGKTFLHCGDLGHIPDSDVFAQIGNVDALFIPVGGHYTIDAEKAVKIVEILDPILVFPMHYKTSVIDFPIREVTDYLRLIRDYRKIEDSQLSLTDDIWSKPTTLILNYE